YRCPRHRFPLPSRPALTTIDFPALTRRPVVPCSCSACPAAGPADHLADCRPAGPSDRFGRTCFPADPDRPADPGRPADSRPACTPFLFAPACLAAPAGLAVPAGRSDSFAFPAYWYPACSMVRGPVYPADCRRSFCPPVEKRKRTLLLIRLPHEQLLSLNGGLGR